jgi:hypothetical protein
MSPDLTARLQQARAQLAEFRSQERQYLHDAPAQAQIAAQRAKGHEELIRRIQDRLDGLVLRAPHDGVVVPGVHGTDPQAVIGAFVHRGERLCEIVDTEHLRIAAPLSTVQAAPLIELPDEERPVEIRSVSSPDTVLGGVSTRIIPAGQRIIPHPALAYAGGGEVESDPQDKSGLAAKSPQFIVYVQASGLAAPGERVRLRFSLPRRPLIFQWADRFRRLVQGRVDI